MLQWAADTAVGWKGCTKKLSAISRQLSVGSKAPLSRAGLFFVKRAPTAEIVPWQTNTVQASCPCGYHLICGLGRGSQIPPKDGLVSVSRRCDFSGCACSKASPTILRRKGR